jgi:hypothetical protein
MRKRRSPSDVSCAKARKRALAKARAEAKLRRWRETHVYAERICERLARRLRTAREALGLTMYEVEMASGVCQRPPALPFGLPAAGYVAPLRSWVMVARMETGRSVPSAIVLVKVALAFRVPLPKALVALSSWLRR